MSETTAPSLDTSSSYASDDEKEGEGSSNGTATYSPVRHLRPVNLDAGALMDPSLLSRRRTRHLVSSGFSRGPQSPKMPPTSGSKSGRVRPSEVAADTKRNFIPMVKDKFGDRFPPYSLLYRQPMAELPIQRRMLSTRPPAFRFEAGDPVMRAIYYGALDTQASEASGGARVRVPFICAANERRPGGDWETGCAGYEEKLCRRSNLSATLSAPWPETRETSNYPIPSVGGILSDSVVVCRGPHDRYEILDSWYDLPVVSVPPTRWPKLKEGGSKYSFAEERDMIREKIRGALRICLFNNYDRVVIGDFGLGNGYRNPPQELAEIWRDVFLFDPDVRGRFAYVIFVFEDPAQSTMRFIHEEMAKKEKKSSSSKTKSSRSESSGSSSSSKSRGSCIVPTDMSVFERAFNPSEVDRVLSRPDPRYGLDMITS